MNYHDTYLLIANGKFALRLLVCLGKSLEFQDRLRLGNVNTELHIRLGVFVARLDRNQKSQFLNG